MSLDGMIVNSRPRATTKERDQANRQSTALNPISRIGDMANPQGKNPRRVPLSKVPFSSPVSKGLRTKPSASNSFGAQQMGDSTRENSQLNPTSMSNMANFEFMPKDEQPRQEQPATFMAQTGFNPDRTSTMFNEPSTDFGNLWSQQISSLEQMSSVANMEPSNSNLNLNLGTRNQIVSSGSLEDQSQTSESLARDHADSMELIEPNRHTATIPLRANSQSDSESSRGLDESLFGLMGISDSSSKPSSTKLGNGNDDMLMSVVSSADGKERRLVMIARETLDSLQRIANAVTADARRQQQFEQKGQKNVIASSKGEAAEMSISADTQASQTKATDGNLSLGGAWSNMPSDGQPSRSGATNSIKEESGVSMQREQSVESHQSSPMTKPGSTQASRIDSSGFTTQLPPDSSSSSLMQENKSGVANSQAESSTLPDLARPSNAAAENATHASKSIDNRRQMTNSSLTSPAKGKTQKSTTRGSQSGKQVNRQDQTKGSKTLRAGKKVSKTQTNSANSSTVSPSIETSNTGVTNLKSTNTGLKSAKSRTSTKKSAKKMGPESEERRQNNNTQRANKTNGQQLLSMLNQNPKLSDIEQPSSLEETHNLSLPQTSPTGVTSSKSQGFSTSSNWLASQAPASSKPQSSPVVPSTTPISPQTSTTSSEPSTTVTNVDSTTITTTIPTSPEPTKPAVNEIRENSFDQKLDQLEKSSFDAQLNAASAAANPEADFGDIRESIPGEPGIDYPVYGSPPKTSFSCLKQSCSAGYYADMEVQCQAFHVCQLDGRFDTFLCPNGTIFSQQHFVCVWWWHVDCQQSANYYKLNDAIYCGSSGQQLQMTRNSIEFASNRLDQSSSSTGTSRGSQQNAPEASSNEPADQQNRMPWDDNKEIGGTSSTTIASTSSSAPSYSSSPSSLMINVDANQKGLTQGSDVSWQEQDASSNWSSTGGTEMGQISDNRDSADT